MRLRCLVVNCMASMISIAVSFSASAQSASVDSFPDKPIRIVVPYSPGGIADTMARLLASSLHQSLKQTVIVENKPGANTAIGAMAVAKSPADGYTLLLATGGTVVMNPFLYKQLSYDPEKDFTSVAQVSLTPLVMNVKVDSPIKDIKDLVRLAKKDPGKISYASQGLGSTTQMSMELLQSATGMTLNHVPYKGSGDSINAALSGTVDITVDAIASAMPMIQANKLRPLAVTTDKRSAYLPDTPTLGETVAPDYSVWVWYGLVAPAGTPPAIVAKLNQEVISAMKNKSFSEPLEKNGLVIAPPMTPAEHTAFLQKERKQWKQLIQEKSIRVE